MTTSFNIHLDMLPFHMRLCFQRRLKHYLTSILIGGVIVSACCLVFLSLCSLHNVDQDDGQIDVRRPKLEMTWLLILFMSGPDNQLHRDAIRETWLSDAPSTTSIHKFIIGIEGLSDESLGKIEREQFVHNDLVLFHNLTESYGNLTRKWMWSLGWAANTVKFNYLLKVDDDSYVRVGPLMRDLHLLPNSRLYWGFFNGRANVKKLGKWAEKGWFLSDHYLPYALGGGYVISEDLVHFVAKNIDMLQLYLSEDVSLGTWLAPLKINRIHDERFDTEFVSRGCKNDYLITHKKTAMNMRQMHEHLHATGNLCEQETMKRESYKYDWSALPSNCCVRNDKIIK